MAEAENQVLPGPINDSWRTWLMTGARRVPLDPRRLQGQHRGLKKILGEGLVNNVAESPYTWRDFSGAMVRHAVDDAMRNLPAEDNRVVKLAYFGGYSNRQIAHHVGLTEGSVQRRLRRALAAISDQIQNGRALGRRVVYAIGLFVTGRWLSDSAQNGWQAAAVAGAAAVIVATQSAAPSSAATHFAPGTTQAPASTTTTVVPPVPSPTAPVTVPDAQAAPQLAPPAAGVPSVSVPSVQVPSVQLPSVPLPAPPPPPVTVKKVV